MSCVVAAHVGERTVGSPGGEAFGERARSRDVSEIRAVDVHHEHVLLDEIAGVGTSAIAPEREPATGVTELKTLAGERGSPLVLLPHLGAATRPGRARREAQVGLQALCGLVSR